MRVGVWNLDYAPPGKAEAIRAVLNNQRAEVWVLTETRESILAAEEFAHAVHSDGSPIERKSSKGEDRWVSIWSKAPTVEISLPQPQSVDSFRRACAKITSQELGELIVYALVMPWGSEGNVRWDQAFEFFSGDWESIHKNYPGIPLLIAGDFNTAFGEKGYTRIGATALAERFKKLGLRCIAHKEASDDKPMIDHIAVPEAWQVKISPDSYWPADKANLSDHSGMVVEILR